MAFLLVGVGDQVDTRAVVVKTTELVMTGQDRTWRTPSVPGLSA
jgi:hypothetical protein